MLQASSKKVRSGLFSFVTGVGTVIIKISQSLIESSLLDNNKQGVFNIGNPEEPIKISSLFEMIAFKMKKNISYKEVNQHKTSPGYRKPIIDDSFSNFTKLSRGLDEMINFYSKIDD